MAEKISVQIALEGAEQVKAELAGISVAGQKAFADISAAAAKAGGFDRLDPTLVARKFSELGITATTEINKITRALETAGRTEALVTGVANMEQGVRQLGAAATRTTAAFGLTRREIAALRTGFRQLNLGAVGGQFAALARVGGAFGPVGIGITAVGVAIAGVAAALAKFASQASETEKALTELQKTTGISFENLSSLQQVFAAGGTSAKQFAQDFGKFNEQVDAAGQARAIRKADQEWVKWANDINANVQKFDNIANGAQVVFSRLTTLDTKLQAIRESLSKVSGEARQFKLADIMKNLSPGDAAQIGKGLGFTPEEIATLRQGSAAIREQQAEIQRLGLTLTDANQQALQQYAQGWNQLTAVVVAAIQKLGAVAAPAFTALFNFLKQTIASFVQDVQSVGWGQAFDNALPKIQAAFAPVLNWLGTQLSSLMAQGGTAAGNAFVNALGNAIMSAISSIFRNIEAEITKNINILIDNILRALKRVGIGPGGQLGPGGGVLSGARPQSDVSFASGGMVGGRGTGTSDSNLAWVSRGEHIMPASAVAAPGVLAFLEALRRSGGNLRAVLDGMGRFALGGLVPSPRMAFASGGLVRSSNNVTIQFPGVPPVGGLRASNAVVDELRKSAALAQVRSGGRKPSRYS